MSTHIAPSPSRRQQSPFWAVVRALLHEIAMLLALRNAVSRRRNASKTVRALIRHWLIACETVVRSIVLIEAAACGVPIVGSKLDGSREALLDGGLGRLVDPKKREELIEAVAAVLDNHSEHRRIGLITTFGVSAFRAQVSKWMQTIV